MSSHPLHTLSALEQARLIREGAISSEECVRHHLERIAIEDRSLSAFVTVFEDAVKVARRKDLERQRHPDRLPPFHGVPIGIKDLNFVRFTRTRFGSRGMPRVVLPFDDANVRPLRRAGFVFLGKLSTSELGAMPVTEPDIHPPTRNPWSLDHSAGGSSGGSGAAVAAGMLPVAQGSDGAGSIRIPASFCGIYGLKPSRGRVMNQFRLPDRTILYTSGPMARTVADAAALLDVMAGIDTGRTHWAPRPQRPFAERRGRTARLRIKVLESSAVIATDPDVLAAVRRTARVLEGMGHEVEAGRLPDGGFDELLPIWQRLIGGIPLMRWRHAQPVTAWLHEGSKGLVRARVKALQERLADRFAPALAAADLWLTPTVAVSPPRIGAWAGLPPAEAFAEGAKLAAFTALVNLVGLPAASLPAGTSAAGLPIGIQLVGGMFREEDVLAVSWDLEEAMPWRRIAPGHTR
jgi:amidase